jgi:chromosome segregation protein
MYLKRLDVAGFKSFPARTSFEFGQGITAVVGPNGSGKSNIADALRWALGEQSGRLLRARKLEDVIFAGSSQRAATEKAEITLTMDNSDGWLPLDFAEAAITRRAYRSGESEYRINGKQVRLRDLQRLLLHAKAGQNSYAIIGQGLVEAVLNLRAEERRQLVEEAADIQRYRFRIEEAQGKLVATRENMDRAKLLIKEIAPRLSSLERQAQRAAEHARLSRDLAQALQAWYEHHWQRSVEALASVRASHDQAQAEETQVRLAVDTCQRELQSLMQELEERRVGAESSAAQREGLTTRLRELEQSLALARQRRALLEARERDVREETQALEEEETRARSAIQAHQGRRAIVDADLMAARQMLMERRAELANLEGELGGLTSQGASAEEKAARRQAAAAELKARLQRIAASQDHMAKEVARLRTQRRSLISQMAQTVRVLRGMRAQEAAAAAAVLETSGRRPALEAQVAELRASLRALEAKQHARHARLEGLRSRLQVLQEAQERYRQAAAQEPEPEVEIDGFVAAIHQILRVPRGLERAIEAALADYVEGIIVQRQKEAVAAAQAIASKGLSRTYILSLDSIKVVYPLNILKERGVLGVASRLVKCDARFQRLVDALLGRVIIVQDVETGQRVLRRGMGTVVTLDGVVFHSLGTISAGFSQVRRPPILGQEWDLEAVPKEMTRVQRSLEMTEGQIEMLRRQGHEVEARLANLTQEIDAAQGRRLRLQEAVAQRQYRLAHQKGELRGLMAAHQPLRQEDQALHRESQHLHDEQEQLLAEAQASQDTARYLRQAGQVIQQRRDALQEAAREASARVAQMEGELQALAGLSRVNETDSARVANQLSARMWQLQGLATEMASLDQELAQAQGDLAQVQEQSQALLAAHQPDRETVGQMESRQRELHTHLLQNQNRLLQAQRHLLETEAEVRRWETELATLRQRIEDDGLTVSDQGQVTATEVIVPRIPRWLAADADDGLPGNLRPMGGGADIDPQALGQDIDRLRARIRQVGPVSVEAQADYRQLRERHDFLSGQLADLQEAEKALHRAIAELTKIMERRFQTTFAQVAEGFSGYFQQFFGGGHAELTLSGDDGAQAGVDIIARPPGKRLQSLAQLSGGEKALTAVALLFALLQANPSPFCVLDEVDAMLDDTNVGRFVAALQELSKRTQFIVITHNRKTIEVADAIYGVSMGPDSASRVLSLRLSDVAAN